MIIKGDEKHRGHWKHFPGRGDVVRGARLRAGTSYVERPTQHIYPLELSRDKMSDAPNANKTMIPEAPVFRVSRNAAVAASVRINEQAEDDK